MDNLSLELAISKMINLTRANQITWEKISVREENLRSVVPIENIGQAMMATVSLDDPEKKGIAEKTFLLYRYSYRSYMEDEDEYRIRENIQLDIFDPIAYNSLWSFPRSKLIYDLYDAAIIQSEGIDEFMNLFLKRE